MNIPEPKAAKYSAVALTQYATVLCMIKRSLVLSLMTLQTQPPSQHNSTQRIQY